MLKKCLAYLVCLVLILAQMGILVSASDSINVSDVDANGLVTISGNISSGAGKPVSIVVKNTSVDSSSDRLGGIRMSDSCISGADGAYSFKLRPSDGGTYTVKVSGNNGAESLETSFSVANPILEIADSVDSPGETSCIQATLNKGGNIDTLELTFSYDPDIFTASESTSITGLDYFTVQSSQVNASGNITCTLKKKQNLPLEQTAICLVDFEIKPGIPYGEYTVSVTAVARDKYGYLTSVTTESGTFTIQEVSPKTEARQAALDALRLVKAADAINYDNYVAELAVVEDARTKLDYALGLNIKKADFANYPSILEQAEAKLTELQAGFDALALLNGATAETIDEVLENSKEFYDVTEEMLAIYELLEDSAAVRDEIVNKSFTTPVIAGNTFKENLALEAMRQLNWPNMPTVFSALNSVLELDLGGAFAALSEEQKTEVYRSIAKIDYATLDAVKISFGQAVTAAGVIQPSEDRDYGGGGGGISIIGPGAASTPIPNDEIPADYEKGFLDTESVAWAKDAIDYLAEKGIINGKSKNTFAPNDTITREEFAKILVCALGIYEENASADFGDVKDGAWYSSYIASAVAHGIINGVGDSLFGVGQEISRQDMAVMICRAYNITLKEEKPSNASFDDWNEVSDYAQNSIAAMVESGIINGVSETELAPKATATRAQAAVMIYKVLQSRVG